jgi:hypothetical protein
MDASEKHKENLYSVCALVLLILSIGIGAYFYITYKDVRENKETMVLPSAEEKKLPTVEDPKPTRALNEGASTVSLMKIAIPNDTTAVLTDAQGRQTGTVGGQIINMIPLSEFTPDAIAGTVGWIIVEKPSEEPYTLTLTGIPSKSIAVYAKNDQGREDLELLEGTTAGQTFRITYDPTSAENMISVN